MAKTKRAEVLLEPDTFVRLEERATREGISVSDLISRAVEQTFSSSPATRRSALDRIVGLGLPVADWDALEEEILDARAGRLR